MSLSEKYRPKNFEDIVGQEEIVKIIKDKLDRDLTENYIFYGSPGAGKTSTAYVMKAYKNYDFYDFNGSDERGIDFIRDTIKTLSRSYSLNDTKKIIFLDEADQLTTDAQQVMRRIMEDYSDDNIFILSVNDINKLTPALRSRCIKLPFNKLTNDNLRTIAQKVIDGEKITISDEDLKKIVRKSKGDARDLINYISEYQTGGRIIEDKTVVDLETYFSYIQKKDYFKAVKVIKYNTFNDVCKQLLDRFSEQSKFDEIVKIGDWIIPNPQPDSEIGKSCLTAYLIKRVEE